MININRKRQLPQPNLPRPCRRALALLDHGLDQHAPIDNREKIDLIGRQLFGDLWNHRHQSNDQ